MSSLNVNDALKELYISLGGDESNFANGMTVTDYIRLLKTVLNGGGGSGLPEVSDSDNGYILKVINGAWGKSMNVPDRFEITYDNESSGGSGEFDRTSAEIIEAIAAGKEIRFMIAKNAYLNGVRYNTLDDLVLSVDHYNLDSNNDVSQLGFHSCFKGNGSSYYCLAFNIDLTDTDPVLTVVNLTPST